jgi:putative NIF3 family GTP cyclohydrolase 1 type 2
MAYSVLPMKLEKTCDRLIAGNANMEVTGIVTTFMATVDVIRESARLGANLIITHEPTWFSGMDDTGWLQNDFVYRAKKDLIEKEKIAIWRYHDAMHLHKPDEIFVGLIKELGWENYADAPKKPVQMSLPLETPNNFIASFSNYYDIQKTTLRDLSALFKIKLTMGTVRIIGDPDMECDRVGILVGGGSLGLGFEPMPMQVMETYNIHVMVCGDITEWTLPAYVNDAAQLGHKRALLIIGHERSEEWGMKSFASVLSSLVKSLPVHFVDAKEPFGYL